MHAWPVPYPNFLRPERYRSAATLPAKWKWNTCSFISCLCTFSSLAASAPIWTFREDAECDAFDRTVTETFRKSSPACVDNIKALWKTLNTTASQGIPHLFYYRYLAYRTISTIPWIFGSLVKQLLDICAPPLNSVSLTITSRSFTNFDHTLTVHVYFSGLGCIFWVWIFTPISESQRSSDSLVWCRNRKAIHLRCALYSFGIKIVYKMSKVCYI